MAPRDPGALDFLIPPVPAHSTEEAMMMAGVLLLAGLTLLWIDRRRQPMTARFALRAAASALGIGALLLFWF